MNSEPLSESIPKSLKGRACSICFMASSTPACPFAHNGARFHPGGMNIGDVEGVNELAFFGVAGVGDQIGFGKAWGFDIPGIGLMGMWCLSKVPGLVRP